MWPLMLDMTKEESIQNLRHLELEAYSNLVSALRAQGPLNSDKRRLLRESSTVLNITVDRHKAEVRRAISDERLNTIAYHISGQNETVDDWALEGRRAVPLLPRAPPQTSYSLIADEVAEAASQINKQLPPPAATERKRTTPPRVTNQSPATERVGFNVETSKTQTFRVPEVPKPEDIKKRKLATGNENSSLAQHLLGPKLTRIQQIYRQTSKTPKLKQKEPIKLLETQQETNTSRETSPKPASPKINTTIENIVTEMPNETVALATTNDIITTKLKTLPAIPKPTITLNSPIPSPGPSNGAPKSIKVCPPKKTISKSLNTGQKLIVVSNAQTIPTTSILQKTLSVPISKVTKFNLEKFKIVSNASLPSSFQVTTNKQKVVTLKTSPGKKVIPFSQLQMLNSKGGIKVLPIGGKIIGKNIVTTSSPMIVVNTPPQTVKLSTQTIQENANSEIEISENGIREEIKVGADDAEIKMDENQMEIDETTQVTTEIKTDVNEVTTECIEAENKEKGLVINESTDITCDIPVSD